MCLYVLFQFASRRTPLIATLKLIPYWLVNFLIRTGILHRISSVFNLAATNHTEIMSRLTQNKDLQALSAYLFYGAGHTETHTQQRSQKYWTSSSLFCHVIFFKVSLLKSPASSSMLSLFITTSVVRTTQEGVPVSLHFTSSLSFRRQEVPYWSGLLYNVSCSTSKGRPTVRNENGKLNVKRKVCTVHYVHGSCEMVFDPQCRL